MDHARAIQTFEQHDVFGLLFPDQPSIDTLAAAEILVAMLVRMGKTAGSLASVPAIPADTAHYFPSLQSLRPLAREFIISINATNSPVRQLRYEQNEREINVIVTPKSGPISANFISFRDGAVRCDCAIPLGFPPGKLPEPQSLSLSENFFEKTPHLPFPAPNRANAGEIHADNHPVHSISEECYAMASRIPEFAISNAQATILLAGIMDTTSLLRNVVHPDILATAAQLLRSGADYSSAMAIAIPQKPHSLIQLMGRAAARSKIDRSRNIFWSLL